VLIRNDPRKENRIFIRCFILKTFQFSFNAFLGPLPDKENREKLIAIFSSSEKQPPLIFTKGPYDLSFLKSKFWTEPKHENNEEYISWLDKVERKKGQFCKRYRYL